MESQLTIFGQEGVTGVVSMNCTEAIYRRELNEILKCLYTRENLFFHYLCI